MMEIKTKVAGNGPIKQNLAGLVGSESSSKLKIGDPNLYLPIVG